MQTLTQNRSLNRVIIFSLIILAVIAVSWGIASKRASTVGWEGIDGISSDAVSRAGASVDDQISMLQDQIRANPNDWASHSQLGLAYLQKSRETGDPSYYQKAEEALNKSIEQQANDYVTVSAMGALALERHQFHSALEWGERAVPINPDRTYAYGIIADAQIELGQYDEAVETLQIMVDLRPDMSSYSRISYIRELYGDMDGALEMMQQAVDSGTPNLESTAWTRTQLGNLYFNMGNLEGAELEYARTLNDRPGYIYALAGLGRVRAAQGNMDEAIDLLTQATNTMPLPEFVFMLGDLYQANGQPELAAQQYELVRAMEETFKASGVDMDMEIALFNADHNNDLPATVEQARRAFENRPSIHGADALALVLYKNGDYAEAQIYSEEALRLGTKDALKLFHAGMIAYALNEDQEARHYLEQALAINPHFSILLADDARAALRALQTTAQNRDADSR